MFKQVPGLHFLLPALLGSMLCSGQPTHVVPGGYIQTFPNATTIDKGATFQLRAAVMNPVGFELPNRKVAWKSTNAFIATVNASGLVTGISQGRVTIVATSGAAEGTVTVTVNSGYVPPPNTAPVVTITAPADGATFQQTQNINFAGTATDAQQGDLSQSLVWKYSLASNPNGAPTILGTGPSVSTNTLVPGAYLVTASATDSGNLTGLAQIGITVNGPCRLAADLRPIDGQKLPQRLELTATASDTCSRPLAYFWECTSATSGVCEAFNVEFNGRNNTYSTAFVDIQSFEDITILLKVCAAGTNECAPSVQRVYFGAVTSVDVR